MGATDRRGFVGRVTAAVALGAAGLTNALEATTRTAASPSSGRVQGQVSASDAWVEGLKGKHKQIFDMADPEDGVGLLHVRNYLVTYKDAYHAAPADVNAVTTLYGKTVPLGFPDAMWAKYKFGAALGIKDAKTNTPTERNFFFRPQQGDNFAFGLFDSSIENLQKQGVVFILCNNALNFWVGRLAAGGMGTAEAIRADLLANMLPGVVLVPAMVIAINRAQEHGLSYMKLG
jgi:intracellular sulfur oxidation DsrE/DsrF family protein